MTFIYEIILILWLIFVCVSVCFLLLSMANDNRHHQHARWSSVSTSCSWDDHDLAGKFILFPLSLVVVSAAIDGRFYRETTKMTYRFLVQQFLNRCGTNGLFHMLQAKLSWWRQWRWRQQQQRLLLRLERKCGIWSTDRQTDKLLASFVVCMLARARKVGWLVGWMDL